MRACVPALLEHTLTDTRGHMYIRTYVWMYGLVSVGGAAHRGVCVVCVLVYVVCVHVVCVLVVCVWCVCVSPLFH